MQADVPAARARAPCGSSAIAWSFCCGARVDLAQGLVGARRVGLQLHRLLQRGGGLLRLARREQVRAELDVRVEAARVEFEVALPGARGLLVLAGAGRRALARISSDWPSVGRSRTTSSYSSAAALQRASSASGPPPGSGGAGPGSRCASALVAVERDRLLRLRQRPRRPPDLAQQAGDLGADLGRADRASAPCGTRRGPRRRPRPGAPAGRG